MSEYPVPTEVTKFRFLFGEKVRTHVVLEFETAKNPVRVFLSRINLRAWLVRPK